MEHSQRKSFEIAAQKDGIKGFRLTEFNENKRLVRAVDHDQYYPVYYMETFLEDKSIIGFNMASNRECFSALELARDIGKPVATECIMLAQEQENQ